MEGKVISGNMSTGILEKEMMPRMTAIKTAIRMVIGLRRANLGQIHVLRSSNPVHVFFRIWLPGAPVFHPAEILPGGDHLLPGVYPPEDFDEGVFDRSPSGRCGDRPSHLLQRIQNPCLPR